jgi:hypothetical protein
MKQFLVLAVLLLASPACGGGESNRAPRTSPTDPRAELEGRLEKTSVGICNGACRTYRATGARCSGDGTEIEGRTYYLCRIEYETKGGHTLAPDEICAALDAARGHVVLPRGDCR